MLDSTLKYLVERGGRHAEDGCSSTSWIRFFNRDGSVQHEQPHRYRFSSWNTMYRSLLGIFGTDRYKLGAEVTDFGQHGDRMCVTLVTGQRAEADLLICADSVGSIARARLPPAAQRSYSGYVAWRGTLPESEVSPATYALLGDALTYQVLPGSHILVYPIPGLDGSVRRGERLLNMVWYVNVVAGAPLDELMTGRDGVLRPVSLPPGAAAESALSGPAAGRREAAGTSASRGRDTGSGALHPGHLRHRGVPDGVRAHLPDRRRSLRRAPACGRRDGEGGRRRLGPGRGAHGGGRERPGRPRGLGAAATRSRP